MISCRVHIHVEKEKNRPSMCNVPVYSVSLCALPLFIKDALLLMNKMALMTQREPEINNYNVCIVIQRWIKKNPSVHHQPPAAQSREGSRSPDPVVTITFITNESSVTM